MNAEMFKRRLVPSRLARRMPLPYATKAEVYRMFTQLVDQINQKLLILAENDKKIAHAAAQDIRKLTRALQQMQISWSEYVQKVIQILTDAEAKARVSAQRRTVYFPAAPSRRRRRISRSRRRTIYFPAAPATPPTPPPQAPPSRTTPPKKSPPSFPPAAML